MFVLKVSLSQAPSNELWDAVSGILYQHHSLGISEGEIPPPEGTDALVAFNEFELALEPGILSSPEKFECYFENVRDAERALRAIEPLLSSLSMFFSIEESEEKNYAEMWKDNFKPLTASPHWYIRAPWHPKSSDPDAIELIIEPGMAFGTGSHETTRSCLEFIHESVKKYKPTSVLDFGCGSGILAIAYKKLGVQEVYGVDIDPLSVEASENNSKMNEVSFKAALNIEALFSETTKLDGIVANVLKNTLLDYSGKLAALIRKNGFLILSGLLQEQEAEILACYEKLGFKLLNKIVRDDTSPKDLINAADNGQMKWLTLFLELNK